MQNPLSRLRDALSGDRTSGAVISPDPEVIAEIRARAEANKEKNRKLYGPGGKHEKKPLTVRYIHMSKLIDWDSILNRPVVAPGHHTYTRGNGNVRNVDERKRTRVIRG